MKKTTDTTLAISADYRQFVEELKVILRQAVAELSASDVSTVILQQPVAELEISTTTLNSWTCAAS